MLTDIFFEYTILLYFTYYLDEESDDCNAPVKECL